MVELSNEEEVAKGIGSELHVVTLCGVFVFGGTHGFSDAEEDVKGSFLPTIVQTGSISKADTLSDDRRTSGMLRQTC